MKSSVNKPAVGWREWVKVPMLNIPSIKAKVDTGARTSCLHAFDVEIFPHRGVQTVRFSVHPFQRDTHQTVTAEEELLEHRWVTSSMGRRTHRPVIITPVELSGERWDIELTLTNRDTMGFRMLLGREALRNRFMVDPGRSYLGGIKPTPLPKQRKPKTSRSKKKAAS